MRSLITALALVVTFVVAPGLARAAKPARAPAVPSVALVGLKGLVSDDERSALETRLRDQVAAMGFVVVKAQRTAQAQRDLRGLGVCVDPGTTDCLVQVGALAGASLVVAGVASDIEGGTRLELLGVDVGAMAQRGRVGVLLPRDDVDGRALALESAVTGVLKPELWRGTLRIAVAQRGASIYVDDVPRGFAPLADAIELSPGPHTLYVGLEGFRAHKASVLVPYRDESFVDVVLSPGESEPPPHFTAATPSATSGASTEAAQPTPVGRKRPLRVVFYDVEVTGVEPRVGRVLGQLLVAELRKHEHVSVLDSGELRALVGDGATTTGDVRGCSVDACFAEVAEALGADAVVVTQLTNIGGQILFGLRRIDPQRQEVHASSLERVPADDTSALLPLVGKSVSQAFPDVPLRAGQHEGVDERAQRLLHPPPLAPTWCVSLTTGAGAAGVTAIGAFIVATTAWAQHEGGYDAARAGNTPDENTELAPLRELAVTSATLGWVALGATTLLGSAALVTSSFTDWNGDAARMQEAP